jgi:hypothetical protein
MDLRLFARSRKKGGQPVVVPDQQLEAGQLVAASDQELEVSFDQQLFQEQLEAARPKPPTCIFETNWILKVACTPDADLRAHRVALTYHHYARDLDRCINGSASVWSRLDKFQSAEARDANWFNFGTWATATINRDLSLRRSPAGVDQLLPSALRRYLTPLMLHLRAADGQRVSRALGWGQRLVFISTTCIHLARRSKDVNAAGFRGADDDVKEAVFARILELSEWNECESIGKNRHLEVLWKAFDHYELAYKAAALLDALLPKCQEPDLKSGPRRHARWLAQRRRLEALRARHILLANLMITAVEQELVDQAVGDVIDNLPQQLSRAAIGRMALWGERFLGIQRELTGKGLPTQLKSASAAVRETWARFMTDEILVMVLPCETLRLGRDIPPLFPSVPYFPPDLSDLRTLPGAEFDKAHGEATPAQRDRAPAQWVEDVKEDVGSPPQPNRLQELWSVFDRSRGEGRGSAARDWRNYDDRMNWAVNLLRSRQQDLSLFWCPYTQEDQNRIINGELPIRFGDPSEYDVSAPIIDPAIRARSRQAWSGQADETDERN